MVWVESQEDMKLRGPSGLCILSFHDAQASNPNKKVRTICDVNRAPGHGGQRSTLGGGGYEGWAVGGGLAQ